MERHRLKRAYFRLASMRRLRRTRCVGLMGSRSGWLRHVKNYQNFLGRLKTKSRRCKTLLPRRAVFLTRSICVRVKKLCLRITSMALFEWESNGWLVGAAPKLSLFLFRFYPVQRKSWSGLLGRLAIEPV